MTLRLIGWILYALILLSIWYSAKMRRTGRIITSMLAEFRCPCCTYDLSANPSAAKDPKPCPECGALWRFGAYNAPRAQESSVVKRES